MNKPERIWLIDMGDEITWCDCPDPSGDVHPDDVCEYIRADKVKLLQFMVDNGLGPEDMIDDITYP